MCGLHKSQRGGVCDPNVAQNVALEWGREVNKNSKVTDKKFSENFIIEKFLLICTTCDEPPPLDDRPY